MITCEKVEEFLKHYIQEEESFYNISCNEELYIEIYNYCFKDETNMINQFILGSLFYYGEGTKIDYEKALYYYTESYKQGYSRAANSIGIYYQEGKACETNYELTIKWYSIGVAMNDKRSYYNLGNFYHDGRYVPQDREKAYELYLKSAKLNNSSGMYKLGIYYEYGYVVEKDLKQAFYWYLKSAELNNINGILNVIRCYSLGIGCEKNYELAFHWSKIAAELGNPQGMNNLGNLYSQGMGCEKNEEQAFYWFQQSAKLNNRVAMCNLGLCYETGRGCIKDEKQAFYWYQQAVNLKYPNAYNSIAICYEKGIGCEKDEEKAIYYYQLAAEAGVTHGMYNLGMCYRMGTCCQKDEKKGFYWLEKAALKGHVLAKNSLGVCYQKGQGCEINEKKAFELYSEAAALGDKLAMNNLGLCYERGVGCEKDLTKALYWYEESAKKGHPSAMNNLGLLYSNAKSVQRDYDKGFYWFKKAAELNNIHGLNNLGLCYEFGQGTEKNIQKAMECYQKAAELGSNVAMRNLGLCYEQGKNEEKNLELAFHWYKKSADAGNIYAMNNVGVLYSTGQGCKQDYDKAYHYFKTSAEAGNTSAIFNLGLAYENGQGCIRNLELAYQCYQKAADNKNIPSMRKLGLFYEKGIYIEQDLNLSLYWYKQALEQGNEYAREDVERVEKLIEEETLKEAKLVFGIRKDTFISWNHLDKDIKDDICINLEKRNLITVWESDGNGVGNIDENIKNAILTSRSYIVILTGNSIKSKWVEKEVGLILSKIDSTIEYENVIRPIIINRITNKDTHEVSEFDVIQAINNLEDTSPFKKLLNYCASFEDFESGLNYDKISTFLYEAIANSLKIEYKTASLKKYERFSSALNTVVSSRNTKTGIIAATLEFESGYLNRDIYDEDNNKVKANELLHNNIPSLIYGVGGTGKSLYLKNFMRNEFKENRYMFYLECKHIDDTSIEENFITILKQKAFDNHFTTEEANFVSISSFEELFKCNNQIIVLIDALDEISLEKRRKLIEKLYIFYQKYKNVKLIFTTRNKNDSSLIHSEFHISINIYELRGLELSEIEKLYDNLSSKYQEKETIKANEDDEVNTNEEFNPVSYKETFFDKLKEISEDIKKNPLLISNLIFIYFATHKIPDTSFDIINESVVILINDLEEERNSSFEYMDYIANDNINKILGYLALQRSYNNENPAESIIKEYLEENYENIDHSKIADAIYKYLRRRAIIVNENISHEIFKNYFASTYLFSLIYKITKNAIQKKYYKFTEEGLDNLDMLCEECFSIDHETWNNIAIDLLYKLDFEIYYLDPKKDMNEKHLSYKTFNDTLNKTITNLGFNKLIIEIIKTLIDKNSFHYNEFIKKYIN